MYLVLCCHGEDLVHLEEVPCVELGNLMLPDVVHFDAPGQRCKRRGAVVVHQEKVHAPRLGVWVGSSRWVCWVGPRRRRDSREDVLLGEDSLRRESHVGEFPLIILGCERRPRLLRAVIA